MPSVKIALAPHLKRCPGILTLGIRASMGDYSPHERELMRQAEKIYFPSARFVSVFQAIEKPTFPSAATYLYRRSRLHQQILFKYLEIPHGKTRIYYGPRQKDRMRAEFQLPVELMGPLTHPGTIHRATDWLSASRFATLYNPVIVRQAAAPRECMRLTWIQSACVSAQRCRLATSEWLPLEALPPKDPSLADLLAETVRLARSAGLDDIAFDWGLFDERWQVLQMAPPRLQIQTSDHTIRRHDYICDLIRKGAL